MTRRTVIKLLACFIVLALTGTGLLFLNHKVAQPPPIKTADEKVSGQDGIPERIVIPENETSTTVISRPIQAKFAFNAVAPHWQENIGDGKRSFKLRISSDNKKWSDWFEIEAEGPLRDDDPHPDEMFPESPIFFEGQYFQFQVSLQRPDINVPTPELSEVVVTYIDSRTQTITKISEKIHDLISPRTYAADQGPNVISRAGWGSPDPNNTLFKGTDKEWTPTHEPVSQIFIHHTVSPNNSNDFAAIVRGIWQFHSYTRGWGDIGYNYLVDGNGQIYEGRYGGDNVVGGHVRGFNQGSMGVALIGCFQPGDSACLSLNGGNSGPSAAMLDKLYNLLGWKAKNYEIDPRATHQMCGSPNDTPECRTLFTISGHRDGNQTSCPGDYIYNLLPTIRDAAESRRANLFPYAAKQLTYGPILGNQFGQTNVTMQFKNTGTTTWSKTSPRMFLKTAHPNDRVSSFQGDNWFSYQHVALLDQNSVSPGGTGSFTFNMNVADKPPGEYLEGFRVVIEGVTELNSYYLLPIKAPTYEWSVTSINYGSGSAMMTPGQTQTITLAVKNTGTATWSNSGNNPLRLGTWLPGRSSPFYDSSWFNSGRSAVLQEGSVAPNGTGTFTFIVRAPSVLGEYSERFNLVAENKAWAHDNGSQIYFHVVNPLGRKPVSLSHSSETISRADFTGDGLGDLFASSRRSDPAQNEIIFRSTGSGLGNGELWGTSSVSEMPYSESVNVFADIDGDDRDDLITITLADNGINPEIWWQRSTGSGFSAAQMVGRPGLVAQNTRWATGDVNGDGNDDVIAFSRRSDLATNIIVFQSSGTWLGGASLFSSPTETPFASTNFVPADQNGDDKTDLYAIVQETTAANPKIYLLRPNLTSFAAPVLTSVPELKNGDIYFIAADLNGDNNDDLLVSSRRSDPAPNLIAFLSDGNIGYQSIGLWAAPSELRWSEMKIIPADIDGNGDDDLVVTQRLNSAIPVIYWLESLGTQFDTVELLGAPGLKNDATRFAE